MTNLYKKKGVNYEQEKAISFFPKGVKNGEKVYVLSEYIVGKNKGQQEKLTDVVISYFGWLVVKGTHLMSAFFFNDKYHI